MKANPAQLTAQYLAPLNGKSFGSHDELENAVFYLYGPLQSAFPGEGYRDLIDRMIRFGWVKQNGKEYTVVIPTISDAASATPSLANTDRVWQDTLTASTDSLTVAEIKLLIGLKATNGDEFTGDNSSNIYRSLIEKGYVEQVFRLTDEGRRLLAGM